LLVILAKAGIFNAHHPSESWDPVFARRGVTKNWIPAFAGMTSGEEKSKVTGFRLSPE
jgi:hypothetical protein